MKFLFFISLLTLSVHAFELPSNSKQCLVGIAHDWNSSSAILQWFEKKGNLWSPVGEKWNARLGKNGLIWGRGISPIPRGALGKKEGDLRSPAGVFVIGDAWGYDASIQKQPSLSYHQITTRDLWVEDVDSPHYNRHILLDHEPANPWEKKQQMKQDDAAHSLKLFIAHNASPKITPNAGSAIFFHIWRGGGSKATAGCTTMERSHLQRLIRQIDPAKQPLYILLPKAEYEQYRKEWKLP